MKFRTLILATTLVTGLTLPANSAEPVAADGDALCQYILKTSPYQKWKFWPDHVGLQEGDAPHAPQHKVYVNQLGLEAKSVPFPYGTIVVKENIGDDNTVKALTVMYKSEGFNPEGGDWFWAKYSPTGSIESAGKVESCLECHAAVEDNDYIFVHGFE